jgi:hypothetical protein
MSDRCRFGGRFLRLHVGQRKRLFSAHEDLLCARSAYFKNRFQKTRREIEGECVICHEELDAFKQTVTYCKACGNNLHQDCMKQWVEKNNTCPTCRGNWVKTKILEDMTLDELDPDGFDVYVQWLYTRTIPIYEKDIRDGRTIRLIKAHIVGEALHDTGFQQAVRNEIIDDSLEKEESSMQLDALLFAYKKTDGPCALRRFLIDLYTLLGDDDWFLTAPRVVLVDLAKSLLDKVKLQDGEDVWSFMAAAGHIEPEKAGPEVLGESEE